MLLPVVAPMVNAADAVSFQRDIVPLLKSRCAACHLTGEEPGHMALHPRAAYGYLVNVASVESPLLRVAPGAPDESYLVHKLQGTQLDIGGEGVQMPIESGPLAEPDIRMIREWIREGANSN